MSKWYGEDDAEYDSELEGDDVKLFRREWEAEKVVLGRINRFLASLKPADALVKLFTGRERIQWNLNPNARRIVQEDDGA